MNIAKNVAEINGKLLGTLKFGDYMMDIFNCSLE